MDKEKLLKLAVQSAIEDDELGEALREDMKLLCDDQDISLDDIRWYLANPGRCSLGMDRLLVAHSTNSGIVELLLSKLSVKDIKKSGVLASSEHDFPLSGKASRILYQRWVESGGKAWSNAEALRQALNGRREFIEVLDGLSSEEIVGLLFQAVHARLGIPVWIGNPGGKCEQSAKIVAKAFMDVLAERTRVDDTLWIIYQLIWEQLEPAAIREVAKHLKTQLAFNPTPWLRRWVRALLESSGAELDRETAWNLIGQYVSHEDNGYSTVNRWVGLGSLIGYAEGDRNHHKSRWPTREQLGSMARAGCPQYIIDVHMMAIGEEPSDDFAIEEGALDDILWYWIRSPKVTDEVLRDHLPEVIPPEMLRRLHKERNWPLGQVTDQMDVSTLIAHVEVGEDSTKVVRRWLSISGKHGYVQENKKGKFEEHLEHVVLEGSLDEVVMDVPLGNVLDRAMNSYPDVRHSLERGMQRVCRDEPWRWRILLGVPVEPGPSLRAVELMLDGMPLAGSH